ncbi:hypothetical protein Taro_007237, partial [Colocasia esculenta]|nr:hypothetical protein [Colocasia esculenta]
SFSSSLAPAEGSSSRSPTARSPRSFDFEGAVGLGIVAAMNVAGGSDAQTGGGAIARTPRAMAPRRSQPIPIVSARPEGWRRKERRLEEEEDMELSESYTCVISHVGGGAVSKRVYFGDGDGDGDPWGCCPGMGDKAFCSAECRCQQIMSDERRGNWLPDAMKSFDCSPSPCSAAPLFVAAGVAAA